MSASGSASNGRVWFDALTGAGADARATPPTVLSCDAILGGEMARYLAVVPDAHNRFPRARQGEVGLEEGWALAREVRLAMAADEGRARRPIIAIVDVTSQAYGRREELLGVHLACAAAADAYASARLAGHPVIALLVGKAMSGAFLAHGYQANCILALDSPDVLVHAMGQQAAARVTRRSIEDLEQLGERIAPMSYRVRAFASLGLLDRLIEGVNAAAPSPADTERVRRELADAVNDTRRRPRDLSRRWSNATARRSRTASIAVRERLAEQWNAS
jgi:malonate decarboxylase gamma subunit